MESIESKVIPGVSSIPTDYGTTSFESSSSSVSTTAVEHHQQEALNKRFKQTSYPHKSGGYQSSTYASKASLVSRSSNRSKESFVFLSRKMTVDKMPNSATRQIVQRVEYFLNVFNHVCIGFVTIYMSWLCLSLGLAGTALHAWLVTFGFSFLMAEAIMCHYTGNVLTFNYKRTTKTTIHWVLQVLGGGCGVAGVLIKLIQKGFLLHSTHGKLGFAAFILCLFSMLTGLSALFSLRLKRALNPLLNKSLHNLLGLVAFVLALAAQFYGYQTGFFSRKVSNDFQTLMKCITLISLFLTCIGPLKALYNKTCNIIKHFS